MRQYHHLSPWDATCRITCTTLQQSFVRTTLLAESSRQLIDYHSVDSHYHFCALRRQHSPDTVINQRRRSCVVEIAVKEVGSTAEVLSMHVVNTSLPVKLVQQREHPRPTAAAVIHVAKVPVDRVWVTQAQTFAGGSVQSSRHRVGGCARLTTV